MHADLIARLVEAADKLSIAAQTTGGTAGPDTGLMAAVEEYAEARFMIGDVAALRALTEDAVAEEATDTDEEDHMFPESMEFLRSLASLPSDAGGQGEAVRALVEAAQETWDQACANHDKPPPVKYTAPYGGLVKLKAALDALAALEASKC